MTRKRFVKLVMSCGHDRNYANARAETSILHFGSYQKAWYKSYDLAVIYACKGIVRCMTPLLESILRMLEMHSSKMVLALKAAKQSVLSGGENDDRSYAGGSTEMDPPDLPGAEEHGTPVEQAEHVGTISG